MNKSVMYVEYLRTSNGHDRLRLLSSDKEDDIAL
jgi:hypothetical protein